MLNKIIITLSIFFYLSIYSQDNVDDDNPVLSWEPIPNAISYQLQIRNEKGETILDENVKGTSYSLNLVSGKYTHRVGSYNKFHKISSFSDWFPFYISKSMVPEITSDKMIVSSKNENQKVIFIEGKYFFKNTWIILKNDNAIVPISSMNLKKGGIEIVLDNENANAGTYDLYAENPRKKILAVKNFYLLKPGNVVADNTNSPYPYWKHAGRSTVLPGWGQIKKDHTFSAIFFDTALVLSIVYYKSSLDTYHLEKKEFNQSISKIISYHLIDEQGGLNYGIVARENQLHRMRSASNSLYGAAILISSLYSLNILDALLWKTSAETSSKESSLHFYTKIRANPVTPVSNSIINSSQFEIGFRLNF